jgi:TRAP-type C4-dicarboxylate transport system permease small subunit
MGAFKALAAVVKAAQRYIVIFTGAAACLLITIAAVMRYVFSKDFYGSEELIMLTAFWLYFMGASLATREDSHITADLITTLAKTPRRARILKLAQHAISLGVSAMGTSWAWNYYAWSWARSPRTAVLKFPIVWLQTPILVFFVLSTAYLVGHVVNDVRRLAKSEGVK